MITYWCCYTGPTDESLSADWACGRIYMTDKPYSETLGEYVELPMMHIQDWQSMADWLDNFGTEEPWSLEDLIGFYEERHSPITWYNKHD